MKIYKSSTRYKELVEFFKERKIGFDAVIHGFSTRDARNNRLVCINNRPTELETHITGEDYFFGKVIPRELIDSIYASDGYFKQAPNLFDIGNGVMGYIESYKSTILDELEEVTNLPNTKWMDENCMVLDNAIITTFKEPSVLFNVLPPDILEGIPYLVYHPIPYSWTIDEIDLLTIIYVLNGKLFLIRLPRTYRAIVGISAPLFRIETESAIDKNIIKNNLSKSDLFKKLELII